MLHLSIPQRPHLNRVPSRPITRRERIAVVLLLLVVTIYGAIQSAALFTSTQTSTGNVFHAGTLRLDLTPTASTWFNVVDMAPGDSTSMTALTITNGGSLEMRYSITTGTTTSQTSGDPGYLPGAMLVHLISGTCGGGTEFTSGTLAAFRYTNTLAGGASEHGGPICLKVELPSTAGNAYQDKSTGVTITFYGEQTAHNP